MAVFALKFRYVFSVPVLLIFLHLCTTNASILTDQPSANLSTLWINSRFTDRACYDFIDNSELRPILARHKIDYDAYPKFAFGFFRNSSDQIFYLVTIRFLRNNRSSVEQYNLPPVVLWYANGNFPVKDNATLEFTPDGDLILRDVDDLERKVWSTGSSTSNVTSLTLDGNGNLKLLAAEDTPQWESFDHPTNTWLPGKQRLHINKTLHSRVSASNLSTGMFFLTLSSESINLYFSTSTPQLYQTIPYGKKIQYGLKFSICNNHVTYHSNVSHFNYIRLESNGHLNFYPCADGDAIKESFDLSKDEHYGNCIYPTHCGKYGVCSYGNNCSCPGARYFKQSEDTENGFSCTEVTPLSCKDLHHHTFLQLENVAYFGFVPHINNTDVESCKRACLKNCSCKAALFLYDGNLSIGNCSLPTELYTLWNNTGLNSHYNALTFIKVQKPYNRNKNFLLLSRILFVSAFLTFTTGAYYFYKWRKGKTVQGSRDSSIDNEPSVLVNKNLRKFSLEDMVSATWKFKVRLGRGGFGSVFEGILGDGTKVAVKRLSSDLNQGMKEFLSEVDTIGNIHHFNLVKLIGYCAERSNRLLVYEYMCNGSLDKWIFHQKQAQALTWETRKKIIIQIAKGLEYLHDFCNPNIIHFDIKPHNILLDGDFNVKIADFGLARFIDRDRSHVSTMPKGTPGYMAPELITGKNLTVKTDVFSFGVVILEIICGRKNSNSWHGDYLIDTLRIKAEEDRLSDLVDKQSEDMQRHKEDALKIIRIAISCLQTNLYRRPSASMLVKVLEGLTILETVTDYSFLNFFSVRTPPMARLGSLSSITPSILSGAR